MTRLRVLCLDDQSCGVDIHRLLEPFLRQESRPPEKLLTLPPRTISCPICGSLARLDEFDEDTAKYECDTDYCDIEVCRSDSTFRRSRVNSFRKERTEKSKKAEAEQ